MPVFIFDMDGTITDTNHLWRNYAVRYLESKGLVPPDDWNEKSYRLGWKEYCSELIRLYDLDATPESIWEWHIAHMPEQYAKATEKRDIFKFLDWAKANGIKMAVATATHHELCDPILKRLGLWDYFDLVYTNRQWNTNKLKPDLYLQCCKDLGAASSEAVIFEDALYAIKTAKKAGLYTVAIQDDTELEADEAKALADQFIVNYADLDLSKLPK